MTHRLQVILLLSVICYLLSAVPASAQEITPSVNTFPQLYPAGSNPIADFINNLIPQIKDVNCSSLPSDVCNGIRTPVVTKLPDDEANSALKTQAKSSDNTTSTIEGAYQYKVRSGISLPAEVAQASTNKSDVFGGIIDFIKNILAIANIGNNAADQSARKDLPVDVGDKIINQKSAMNDSLSISQCGDLPDGLCDKDNKLHL